jgi:hypothetical protein
VGFFTKVPLPNELIPFLHSKPRIPIDNVNVSPKGEIILWVPLKLIAPG